MKIKKFIFKNIYFIEILIGLFGTIMLFSRANSLFHSFFIYKDLAIQDLFIALPSILILMFFPLIMLAGLLSFMLKPLGKKLNIILISVLFAIALLISISKTREYTIKSEIVMQNGMEIIAKTQRGEIKILADSKNKRSYVWNECNVSINAISRSERWYGSLGIYYYSRPNAATCDDIKTIDMEEGQQHFDSIEKANKWIQSRADYFQQIGWPWEQVYKSDGLLIGWGLRNSGINKNAKYDTLTVRVWQILINGEKPKGLKGHADNEIEVIFN